MHINLHIQQNGRLGLCLDRPYPSISLSFIVFFYLIDKRTFHYHKIHTNKIVKIGKEMHWESFEETKILLVLQLANTWPTPHISFFIFLNTNRQNTPMLIKFQQQKYEKYRCVLSSIFCTSTSYRCISLLYFCRVLILALHFCKQTLHF